MTAIGILTIIVGCSSIFLGLEFAMAAILLASLLGSAAALLIGSATIQPAHLLLGFACVSAIIKPISITKTIPSLRGYRPGFWLAWAVIYGVAGSYFLPRIFAGTNLIIPIGSSSYDDNGGLVPLSPTSGNITQSIYLVADLICFSLASAVASQTAGLLTLCKCMIMFSALNIIFALLDIVTFQTGTAWTLDFIRNAQYTFHAEESSAGLKRIVGSFLEASSFSHATLAAYGFSGTLFLCNRYALSNGILAAVSLALLLASTSSTGLVGAVAVSALLYMTALRRCSWHRTGRASAVIVLAAPLLGVMMLLSIALSPQASSIVVEIVDSTLLNKSQSLSGLERAAWNAAAWSNFLSSSFLGVGLGTTRASSLVLALLSNLGLFGTLSYLAFLLSSLIRPAFDRSIFSDVKLAARNAAAAQLMSDVISGTLVDQGVLFYLLAAMSCVTIPAHFSQIHLSNFRQYGNR